jgi:hypothetical protein
MGPIYAVIILLSCSFAAIGVGALFSEVVGPRLEDRRRRKNKLLEWQDERQHQLDTLMFEWQKQNLEASREEMLAHKKRLERNLDALHSALEGEEE